MHSIALRCTFCEATNVAHSGRKNAEEAFLMALVCGSTIDIAAEKARISRRTAHTWLQNPAFQKRLAKLKAETIKRFTDMLTAANLEAVKTLLDLQKATTKDTVRLGHAKAIIELGLRLRQSHDLAERLAALEQRCKPTRPCREVEYGGLETTPGAPGEDRWQNKARGQSQPHRGDLAEPVSVVGQGGPFRP